jgi:hypothetical protein
MTIAEIEEQLKQLRQLVVRDQLSSNAYSLNAKGELEEKLTGHLQAQGITLPAQSSGRSEATIEWVNAGGARIAEIVGSDEDDVEDLTLRTGVESDNWGALTVTGGAIAQVSASAIGADTVNIINGKNESSLLRIALPPGAAQTARISWGQGEVQFIGGIGQFIGEGVDHQLGTVPSFAIATLIEGGEIFYDTNSIGVTTLDETWFNFRWSLNVENPEDFEDATAQALWVAIG